MLVGSVALVSVFTCTDATIPAGQNGTTNGLCTFPRGCYLVNASGPAIGQCDDCSSTASCRLVFTPDNPGDYQSITGSWMTTSGQPAPTDWQAICGLYASPSSQKLAVCLAPEAVCVARGPACSGFCIHHSAAAVDGGSGDLGQPVACGAGVPIPPQRRPGATDGGTQTYCPLTDDVCCPAAAGSDGGAAVDGGAADGGPADGGPADLASRG